MSATFFYRNTTPIYIRCNPFGMQVPNRFYNGSDYRYGFNGKEKDDEIKGDGNSYDFGERMHDPRIGRWLSLDKVDKQWLSPYQFADNNPINNVDSDGNDEIHFFYRTQQMLNQDGTAFTALILSSEIIKNNQKHTFFMHSQQGEIVQFHPFKSDMTPNDGSLQAYDAELPLSKGISWFYGLFEKGVDDHAYLGTLLQAAPEVSEHYKDAKDGTGARMSGAVNRASSVDFAEKAITATETAYAIVDGYYLVKGLSKFVLRDIAKTTLKATFTDKRKINLIRNTFKVGKTRNIGTLEGRVGKSIYNETAISGDALREGTVGIPTKRFFNTKDVGGYNRLLDSEVKLLEDFAQKYHNTPDINATLKLTSERTFCESCSGVIQQFKEMFPNVNLELVNGVK